MLDLQHISHSRSPSLHTEPTGTAPPDAFGPFRVLHQVGAGTLGPVFRAYDAERERLVAVKLFKLDLPPERVHQLVAELEGLIVADLNHPGFAKPLATGISGVSAYLAQDYVAAESLDLAIREYGPAPASDALRVAAQVAGALDFAAVVKIHHGALHPRDVLLSPDDTRMTGIGIAQALQKVGVAVPVRRPYTAPERLDDPAITARGDLFSLAAVVFELLTGKRIAGTGQHVGDAVAGVAGANVAALRQVFARALAESPADRFDTALEFVEALKQAFSASSIASPQPPGRRSKVETRKSSDVEPIRDEPPRAPVSLPFDVPEASDRADVELPIVLPQPSVSADPSVHESVPDLQLAAAEEQRYADVEPGPVAASSLAATVDHVGDDASGKHDGGDGADEKYAEKYNVVTSAAAAPPAWAPDARPGAERRRSAVWPILLALIVGVAVGFAAGYGVGNRDRSTTADSVATRPSDVPAPPPRTAGREFTESAVPPPRESRPAPAEPRPAFPPAAREPDTATAPGRLLIHSLPSGARVTVDGKEAGTTPAVVRELPTGTHRVRVTREGYTAADQRVVITAKRPAQTLNVSLERERRASQGTSGGFNGGLFIDSRPAGAKVFLDGKLIGTTPLGMASVAAGEHAVRLEYDGYRRWTSSVRVVAGEQNRVTASLEK